MTGSEADSMVSGGENSVLTCPGDWVTSRPVLKQLKEAVIYMYFLMDTVVYKDPYNLIFFPIPTPFF